MVRTDPGLQDTVALMMLPHVCSAGHRARPSSLRFFLTQKCHGGCTLPDVPEPPALPVTHDTSYRAIRRIPRTTPTTGLALYRAVCPATGTASRNL